ncbi:DUF6772 family protein [Mesorhizobium sp.]
MHRSRYQSIRMPAMKNLWCKLNFCVSAETDVAQRAFPLFGSKRHQKFNP